MNFHNGLFLEHEKYEEFISLNKQLVFASLCLSEIPSFFIYQMDWCVFPVARKLETLHERIHSAVELSFHKFVKM